MIWYSTVSSSTYIDKYIIKKVSKKMMIIIIVISISYRFFVGYLISAEKVDEYTIHLRGCASSDC